MIQIENTVLPSGEQWNSIIMGLRNPLNSWGKSDSVSCINNDECSVCEDNHTGRCYNGFVIGNNDLDLMKRLRNAGTDHRKFMRMITVYATVNAPIYWWKEYDTYKVGTVANSCSTMHKIHDKEFDPSDFSYEHLENFPLVESTDNKGSVEQFNQPSLQVFEIVLMALNTARYNYLKAKENGADGHTLKRYWWQMIQLLPSSYNQKRTVMLNYEVLANMYRSRRNHKLDEWVDFCKWIETLPYAMLITGGE